MAKYTYTIKHVDEDGEQSEYEFRAVGLTKRQIKDAMADYDEEEDDDPILPIAFRSIKKNGEEVEDWDELLVEVLNEGLAKHPSFRTPNTGGRRRKGR